jgi:rhomboid family GlyGly-CTERM serine protease
MQTFLTSARFPLWAPWLGLLAVCAILQILGAYPALRLELPLAGDSRLYSVFTCHLVHLNARHWLSDAVALLLIGWIFIDQYNLKSWLLTCCLSAFSVSLGLLLYHPGLRSYAGLSGLLHGLFVMGCLLLLSRQFTLALVLLVLLLVKLVVESFYGSLLVLSPGFTVASIAHLYGLAGGILSWLCWISLCALRGSRQT